MSKSTKFEASADELKPMKNGDSIIDTKPYIDAANYEKPKQKNWLYRRLYVLNWLQNYDREKAIADVIAGITLGLTIIPQSIAYAALAGLSSEYGLYTAIVGKVFYALFGTIPQVSIGPTSLMSLMVLQFVGERPIQFVFVLSFLAGLVEFIMGAFQLGFIVNFIPTPVTKSFTSATAIIIASVQLKTMLGVRIKGVPTFSEFFHAIKLPDAILGFICIAVLLTMRKLAYINFKEDTVGTRRMKKLLWYISISRNAFVVFVASLVTYIWVRDRSREAIPFSLTKRVDSAQLAVHLPPFFFEYQNTTYGFIDICRELGSGIIVVPIVAILANVAIAKAFVKDGKLDASQEMLTLGICNLAGSCFSCFPTCGAFTRSAVSQASGVRTPISGIYTAMLVYLALNVLTPYFGYIPKPAISAVLVSAVIFLIDFTFIKDLWHNNKKDFFSWFGCFLVGLVGGVQLGLLVGIGLKMMFVIARLGNPQVKVTLKEVDGFGYVHIEPTSDVYYSGIDYIREEINNACLLYRNEFPIVLECTRFMQFDATFVEVLFAIGKELEMRQVLFVLQNLTEKRQSLIPEFDNIRYCNNAIVSAADLAVKK